MLYNSIIAPFTPFTPDSEINEKAFSCSASNRRITSVEGNQARVAELTSVAVNPGYHGQGVGKRLVLAFNSLALEQGASVVTLTTDAHNNHM